MNPIDNPAAVGEQMGWFDGLRLGDTWVYDNETGSRIEMTRKATVTEVRLRENGVQVLRRLVAPDEDDGLVADLMSGCRPQPRAHRPDPDDPLGDYVVVGSCWIWQGQMSRRGPLALVAGRPRYARPLVYERYRGHPLRGDFADTTCGDPGCVSPLHAPI